MTTEIESFIHYLEDVKQSSRNTVVSYQRDLRQLKEYLERQGIKEPAKVTRTCLNSYISYLERKGKATTTISRILASTKAFFHYELMEGNIRRDPAELLKTPKIEKKIPVILSVEEVNRFLEQPEGEGAKEVQGNAGASLCNRDPGFRADRTGTSGCESGSWVSHLQGRGKGAGDPI